MRKLIQIRNDKEAVFRKRNLYSNPRKPVQMILSEVGQPGKGQRLLLDNMNQSQQIFPGMQKQLGGIGQTGKITAAASFVDACYSRVAANELKKIIQCILRDWTYGDSFYRKILPDQKDKKHRKTKNL